MRLKDVYKMVSTYWVSVTKDEKFRDRLVYEAIVINHSDKNVEWLRVYLSPESFKFAMARIEEIRK
ncbi:MAG: hypothetical protein ACRCZ2_08740 [Fusobacteriaceae bacterium]